MFFKRDKNKKESASKLDYEEKRSSSQSKKADNDLKKLNRKHMRNVGGYGLNLSKGILRSAAGAFIDLNPVIKETVQDNVDEAKRIADNFQERSSKIMSSFEDENGELDKTALKSIKGIQKLANNLQRNNRKKASKDAKDLGIEIDDDKFLLENVDSESYDDNEFHSTTVTIENSDSSIASLSNIMAGSFISLINVNKQGFESILSSVQESVTTNIDYYGSMMEMLELINRNANNIAKSSMALNLNEAKSSIAMEELLMGNLSINNFMDVIKNNRLSDVAKQQAMIGAQEKVQDKIMRTLMGSEHTPKFLKKILDLPTNIGLSLFQYASEETINDSKIFDKLKKIRESEKTKSGNNGDSFFGSLKDKKSKATINLIDKIVGDGKNQKGISAALKKLIVGDGKFNIYGIDTRNNLSKNTKVNFDAETHNTINTVIPGYLARILSNLTGNEMIVNDYSSGKWISSSKAKTDYDKKIKDTIKNNNRVNDLLKNALGDDEVNKLDKSFDEILYAIVMDPSFEAKDLLDQNNPLVKEHSKKLYDYLTKSEKFSKEFRKSVISAQSEVSRMNKNKSISGSLLNAFNDKELDSTFSKFEAKVENNSKIKTSYLTEVIDNLEAINRLLGGGNKKDITSNIKETIKETMGENNNLPDILGKEKTSSNSSNNKTGLKSTIKEKLNDMYNNYTEQKRSGNSSTVKPDKGSSSKYKNVIEDVFHTVPDNDTGDSVIDTLIDTKKGNASSSIADNIKTIGDFTNNFGLGEKGGKAITLGEKLLGGGSSSNLLDIAPENLSGKVSLIEDQLKNFDGSFSDTISKIASGKKLGGKSSLGSSIASKFMTLTSKLSASSAGSAFTKAVKVVASPKFLLPVLGGALVVGAGKKLLKALSRKKGEDEFGEEDKEKNGILTNILTLFSGLLHFTGGKIAQFIGGIFTGQKIEPKSDYGQPYDFSERDYSSYAGGAESRNPLLTAAEELENIPVLEENFNNSEIKAFESTANASDTILSGESISKIDSGTSASMKNLLGNQTNISGSKLSASQTNSIIKNFKGDGSPVSVSEFNNSVNSQLSTITNKNDASGLTSGDSPASLSSLVELESSMKSMVDGNAVYKMYRDNPAAMGKKLLMFSPLGSAIAMTDQGFDPSNPNSGIATKITKYFKDITKKVETAFAIAVIGSGSGGGSGGGASGTDSNFTGGTGSGLGIHSRKFEIGKNGNGGMVSSGANDPLGGISYGIPQFSSKQGSAKGFVNDLMKKDPKYEKYFKGKTPGSKAFSDGWRQAYADHGAEFEMHQLVEIQRTHYNPWIKMAKRVSGVDFNRSRALQEVAWSVSLQHGGGSSKYLTGISSGMSDAQIITKLYQNRHAKASVKTSARWREEEKIMNGLIGQGPVALYGSAAAAQTSTATASTTPASVSTGGAPGSTGTGNSNISGDSGGQDSGTITNGSGVNADKVRKQIEWLHRQIGGYYTQGGGRTSWSPEPVSADCSSLAYKALIAAGIPCGFSKGSQGNTNSLKSDRKHFTQINDKTKIQPGDLVMCNGGGHVVTYIGNGKAIAANQRGKPHSLQDIDWHLSSRGGYQYILRPTGNGNIPDGGFNTGDSSGGGNFSSMNIQEILKLLEEPRPKYLVDWDESKTEAVAQRVKEKYFKLFGYDEKGKKKDGKDDKKDSQSKDKSTTVESGTINVDPNKQGFKPTDTLPKKGYDIKDAKGNVIDTIYIDDNGNILGSDGKPYRGSAITNIINNYFDEYPLGQMVKTDIDEFFRVNNESLDLLKKLLTTTKSINENVREILLRLINALGLLKDQNDVLGNNNKKTHTTNELLEKLRISILNSIKNGNNNNNKNPIIINENGSTNESYDFQLLGNSLIDLILAGG